MSEHESWLEGLDAGVRATLQQRLDSEKIIDGFRIQTFESYAVEPPWIAVNMTASLSMLAGYGLTPEEKVSLPHLAAGYARLLDEYGLEGHGETEFQAIQDLFKKKDGWDSQ